MDPGLSGGLALLDPIKQTIVASSLMPKIKRGNRSELDPYVLSKFIEPHCMNIKFAIVEDVGARPGQGVTSMFVFGFVTGVAIGVLGAFQIDIIRIQPAIWKQAFGLSSDKSLSFNRASEIFPRQKDMWALKKEEGICEAVLMAKYGERFL